MTSNIKIFLIKNIINNLIKLYKKKISEINYIIINFETIIKNKEKEILAKRKEILLKLRENMPIFKREFISALCMGLFLGICCTLLASYYDYDGVINIKAQTKLYIPKELKEFKWYKPLTYDFPYETYVGKIQLTIAWVFNDIIDVYNCPIYGLSPGISPDLYF